MRLAPLDNPERHRLRFLRIDSRDCFHLEASFRTSVVIGFADRRNSSDRGRYRIRVNRSTPVVGTKRRSACIRLCRASRRATKEAEASRITEDRSIDRSLGFVRFYVTPTFPRVFDSTLLCILPPPLPAAIERIAINARYRFIEPRRPDFRFTRYRPAIPDLIIRRRLAGHRKREYTRIILLDGRVAACRP